MSDTQDTNDTTPPTHDAEGRPLTTSVIVAEGPNTNVHADQVKTAHAAPDGEVQYITHDDGSKSVAFADTPSASMSVVDHNAEADAARAAGFTPMPKED